MSKSILFLIMIFFISACKKELVSEVPPQTPYELWRAQNIHDYSIDQKRTCYCPDAGEVIRVMVRADTIFSLTKASDGSQITNRYYYTVDSLFGILKNPNHDSLVVKYDAKYGYPLYIDINPQQHPVDGGVLIESNNLQLLK